MKELHCSANFHFEPLRRVHDELSEQGIQGFLTYSEAPVCSPTLLIVLILTSMLKLKL